MSLRALARVFPIVVLATFILAFVAQTACSQSGPPPAPSQQPPSTPAPSKAEPSKAPPSEAPAAKEEKAEPGDPNTPEKDFTITAMDLTKIKCTIYPNVNWPGKIVRFEPSLTQAEMNILIAAQHSMWQIYGQQSGSFKLQDASLTTREPLVGNVIAFKLKSGRKFLVYPTRDKEGKSLTHMRVWME